MEKIECYNCIASVDELKWFFEHVIQKPAINESYSMVFVSRHKKLTEEERKIHGISRKDSEFLSTQSIRLNKIKDSSNDLEWSFDNFLRRLRRFNVDKYAYTNSLGEPLLEKTLAILFYINPCDEMIVADKLVEQIECVKTSISKAMLNGKNIADNLHTYQLFGNLENNLKHFKANCKGATYWMDFDIDVPAWFKDNYFANLHERLTINFGKGNFVVVDTSGGYHVLVKTVSIKSNPNYFINEVKDIYNKGISAGYEQYLDDKGNLKFECTIVGSHQKFNAEAEKKVKDALDNLQDLKNNGAISAANFKLISKSLYESVKTKDTKSSIPGIPLPGTFQYGRPVVVINKEDFE